MPLIPAPVRPVEVQPLEGCFGLPPSSCLATRSSVKYCGSIQHPSHCALAHQVLLHTCTSIIRLSVAESGDASFA